MPDLVPGLHPDFGFDDDWQKFGVFDAMAVAELVGFDDDWRWMVNA